MRRITRTLSALAPALLLLVAVSAAGLLSGCGTDATVASTAKLTMQASMAQQTVAASGFQRLWKWLGPNEAMAVTGITSNDGQALDITDFLLSIRDIKFKKDDDVDPAANEVEIRGPFVVDLLSPAQPLSQFIGEAQVPADTYDGIRFVMHVSDGIAESLLTDRSLYIAGTNTTSGNSFEIVHDTGENLDAFGPNGFVMEPGALNNVIVDIRLLSIFDTVDMASASGLIGPGNPIADQVKDAIKAAADFGEDSNDDGVLDETEDVN